MHQIREFFKLILLLYFFAHFVSCSESEIEPPSSLYGASFYPLNEARITMRKSMGFERLS